MYWPCDNCGEKDRTKQVPNPGFLGSTFKSGTSSHKPETFGAGPHTVGMDSNEASPQHDEQNDVQVHVKKSQNVQKKLKEALVLPTCMNLNPRSIYNKLREFVTFIKEENVHAVFLSESWERPEFDLSHLIDIDDFTVISNPHQRKGKGGRPALIINTSISV